MDPMEKDKCKQNFKDFAKEAFDIDALQIGTNHQYVYITHGTTGNGKTQ
jgi:hypothetical protein